MPIISHKLEELKFPQPRGTMLEIECDECSVRFLRRAKLIHADIKRGRKSKGFFCSRICHTKHNVVRHEENLICVECGKKYTKKKDPRSINSFCSRSCAAKFNKNATSKKPKPKSTKRVVTRLQLKCEGCGKQIIRLASQLKKTKHKKPYCSRSCRMSHYNRNILKRTFNQRSRAEDILFDIIQKDFKFLVIKQNVRDILPSGLEIDLYLPSISLAIELNGPTHYFPIYGNDKLSKIQSNDVKKRLEIHQMNINLLTIDISHLQSKAQTHRFLLKQYDLVIKPLILEAGSASESDA